MATLYDVAAIGNAIVDVIAPCSDDFLTDEGLAKGAMTYDETARRERLLAVVKRAVRMLNRKGDVQDLWAE